MKISKLQKYGILTGLWSGFLSVSTALHLASLFNIQNKLGLLSLEIGLIILISFISIKIVNMLLKLEESKWDM